MSHTPITIEAVTDPDCLAGECEHEDCPVTEVVLCGDCAMLAETVSSDALERGEVFSLVVWPCATAKALEELRAAWTPTSDGVEYLQAQRLRLERDWPALAAALYRINT